MKKKKLIWGMVIAVVVIIAAVFLVNYFGNQNSDEIIVDKDPFGIEYYTVPPMNQIFVNGVVTPEQSQEFYREESS